MNIKDQNAHDLARELARLTGQTLTDAVKTALRQELIRARARHNQNLRAVAERLDEIALRCASLPDRDTRTPDEIIGYDANGLPV